MKCPECHFDNPEGVNFCVECGAKSKIICPNCGYRNAISNKFCGGCGHKLSLSIEFPRKGQSFDEKLTKIHKYLPEGLTEDYLFEACCIVCIGDRNVSTCIMRVSISKDPQKIPVLSAFGP